MTTEHFKNIDQRFDAVDAEFKSIDQRFDAVDAKFKSIDQRFDAVDAEFKNIDQRFDAVDAKFKNIDQRFDAVDDEFAKVREEMRNESAALRAEIKAEGETTRRHFDVMVEKVETAVRVVAEATAHHATVLDTHEKRLQVVEKRS